MYVASVGDPGLMEAANRVWKRVQTSDETGDEGEGEPT